MCGILFGALEYRRSQQTQLSNEEKKNLILFLVRRFGAKKCKNFVLLPSQRKITNNSIETYQSRKAIDTHFILHRHFKTIIISAKKYLKMPAATEQPAAKKEREELLWQSLKEHVMRERQKIKEGKIVLECVEKLKKNTENQKKN